MRKEVRLRIEVVSFFCCCTDSGVVKKKNSAGFEASLEQKMSPGIWWI